MRSPLFGANLAQNQRHDFQSFAAQVVAAEAWGGQGVPRNGERGQAQPGAARRVIDQLSDDVLMVTRLDRLARATRDLSNTLAAGGGRQPARPLRGRAVRRIRNVSRATPSFRRSSGDSLLIPSRAFHPDCPAAASAVATWSKG
jgi:hypothetical protein